MKEVIYFPISVPFNVFISEIKHGRGSFSKESDQNTLVRCTKVVSSLNCSFASHLDNYLVANKLDHVIWQGEKITTWKQDIVTSGEDTWLIRWVGSMAQWEQQLENEIKAYYKIKSAAESLYFHDANYTPSADSYTQRVAFGVVNRMVEALRCKYRHDLYDVERLHVSSEDALYAALGLEFRCDVDMEPEMLTDLDLKKLWRWLVVHVNVENINTDYCIDLASCIVDDFVQKRDYKMHSTMKMFSNRFQSFRSIMKILGLSDSFEYVGKVGSRFGDMNKVKLPKPALEKLTIFINKFNKEALIKSLDRKERGML